VHRFFLLLTSEKSNVRPWLVVILFLWITHPTIAREFAVQGGAGFTTQSPALFGLAVSANLRGDSNPDSWFSDTQLVYHWLRTTSIAEDDDTSATITFRSLELNWFYLLPIESQGARHFFWGPGIGYGVAEVQEDISSESSNSGKDPTRFFSADDIHYGTLLLKFGFNWSNKTCEGRLSSFGGLIGGTVICGIIF
jgi:hypothetical protein